MAPSRERSVTSSILVADAPAWRSIVVGAVTAWLLVSVVYFHLLVIYADWPPEAAAGVAVLSVGTATVLGVPVWWISGRLKWPRRWPILFVAVHLVFAITFSVAWLTIDIGLTHTLLADGIFRRKVASMRWEALLGLWVYGLIAGISYAIRARRETEAQQRVAERAAAIAAEAQLAALRSQLNPHFLFNVLHSLGTLARRDVERLDEALERLGNLLRHALDPGSIDRVPLADDLAFAENYIEIERLRLGDRLRIETDVSDDALDVPIPFLTLQPLVENAILHGIDRVPAGGTITIRATAADGALSITVTDDGAGDGGEPPALRNGVGLGALKERLALTYDRFDLVCASAPQGGYRVQLTIPAV